MRKEKEIRKKILKEVKEYYKVKKSRQRFIPGETLVNYGGRVYDEKEMRNLVDASLDFWLTAGRYARQFEKDFATFVGTKYCMLTNSGSSANLLAVSALTSSELGSRRLKPGDEVITTACGFPTTLNPIIQNKLIPVFIDVDLATNNIKAKDIKEAITKKTKAIFIAHTLGNPVNLDEILKIVKRYNLWFIEDNCDALGSRYRGKYTGSFGHLSTSSFYPPHHITMGEGGAVLTDDALLRRLVLSFRDWGRDCWCEPGCDNTCKKRFSKKFGSLPFGYDHKYIYSHIGYNLKLTDMQAAIGVAQLKKLPGFIEARKKNFKRLYEIFKKYEEFFILPEAAKYSKPSWFGFPVLVKDTAPFKRADVVSYLEDNNIATRMLFGGNLTRHPAYRNIRYKIMDRLDNTDLVMNNLFWIGVYPGLTKDMLAYINSVVEKFFIKIS